MLPLYLSLVNKKEMISLAAETATLLPSPPFSIKIVKAISGSS